MLKEDVKQNLVLIGFCFLLREYLTESTLIFVAVGLLLVFLGKRPNKLIRNILAITVFASYWVKYGKIIDPEIGVNFLTSIITLKILEKETVRDRYMIFFGMLLLISAGSLFERSLTYVIFFGISFLTLLNGFYSYLGLRWKLKDIVMAVVWIFPLAFALFFLVPRLLNPIPFHQSTLSPGEIGYTPEVNISDVDTLQPNDAPVFHVITSRKLSENELYWRGNTLSYTDGWNWKVNIQDKTPGESLLGYASGEDEIKQSFRIFIRPEYFFSLDTPSVVTYGKEYLRVNQGLKTLPQRRWEGVQKYEVYSNTKTKISDLGNEKAYLQVPLTRAEKEKIHKMFPEKNLDELSFSIRQHFLTEQFSYSLQPGRSLNFSEFMDKKIGFCSHYASAVALIMRVKGIPTRLVSGFLGGTYNRFADFYLVGQNDAHVWLEAWSEGSWKKIDPTEWISPDRVLLGGEAFVESVSRNALMRNAFFRLPPVFNEIKMWFGQWDFVFYQWLENMDYYSQDALFSRFKLKRQWLFTLIPIIMVLFMVMYTLFLATRKSKNETSPYQELWNLFLERTKKRGLELSNVNLSDSAARMEKDPEAQAVFYDLVSCTFQGKNLDLKLLKRKIRNL